MNLSKTNEIDTKSKRRRNRTVFTEENIKTLEEAFQRDAYPDIEMREQIADETGIPEARIQTWFQNKRSRAKRSTGKFSKKINKRETVEKPEEIISALPNILPLQVNYYNNTNSSPFYQYYSQIRPQINRVDYSNVLQLANACSTKQFLPLTENYYGPVSTSIKRNN